MTNTTTNTLIGELRRQGDVLFVKIEALPAEVALTERKGQIVVEGEVTGHAHRLAAGRILEAQGMFFLEVLKATQVVHEEHHAIDLAPGIYQVIRQREYSPEAIRTVLD